MSKPKSNLFFSTFLIFILSSNVLGQTILHVDEDASINGDGTSWATAYKYLQNALWSASANPNITEIRVATGTYRPDEDETNLNGTSDRDATFQLISGVELNGGYRGCPLGNCASEDPDENDISIYETILSGDLSEDDSPVACIHNSPECDSFGKLCVDNSCIFKQNNGENSYHVVTGSDTDTTATIKGFTITAGIANFSDIADSRRNGGGMYNVSGSPTVINCSFIGNRAFESGGGMYNTFDSNPTVINCLFRRNRAFDISSGIYSGTNCNPSIIGCTFSENWGAGMANRSNSNSTLIGCTFSNNLVAGMVTGSPGDLTINNSLLIGCTFSENLGTGMAIGPSSNSTLVGCTFSGNISGGMVNGGNLMMTNCLFSGNSANAGGGMFNLNGRATLTNCTFTGNSSISPLFGGGGIVDDRGELMLINCTLSNNTAKTNGGGIAAFFSSIELFNCILWGNSDEVGMYESAQIHLDNSSITISHSIIQGLNTFAGNGNIGSDPLFVNADGTDNIVGTEDDNFRLSFGSPAIDAGDNDAVTPDTADLDDDGNTTEPTPFDLDGSARFLDDPATPDTGKYGFFGLPVVDMGAYEFISLCGNGIVNPGEQCDDGNLYNGDLCSVQCLIEGACCDRLSEYCIITLQEECRGVNLNWNQGVSCNDNSCPETFLPAMSEWGMIILMLSLLIAISIRFSNRYRSLPDNKNF